MRLLFILAITVTLFTSCKKNEPIEGLQSVTSLQQLNDEVADGVTFIFFHASWCHICQDQRPAVTQVATDADLAGVYFGEVEYDDHPDITSAYGINAFPIMVIFKDGVEVDRFTGGGFTAASIKIAIQAQL